MARAGSIRPAIFTTRARLPDDGYGKVAVRAALGTAGHAGIAGYSALGPQVTGGTKDPAGTYIDVTFQHNGPATDFCAATPASSTVGSCGSGGGNSSASFAGVSLNNDGNGAPNNAGSHVEFWRVCDGCTANDESMASGTIIRVSSISKIGATKLRLNLAAPLNAAHLIQVDYGYGMLGGVRGGTGSVFNPVLIFDNDPKITNALDPNAPGKPLEPTVGMLVASLAPLTGGASRPPWAR